MTAPYRQLSYQELAFHLEDSASFRAFARLPWSWSPQKAVLQRTICAIRPETWQAINRALLSSARQTENTPAPHRISSAVAPASTPQRPPSGFRPAPSGAKAAAGQAMGNLEAAMPAHLGPNRWVHEKLDAMQACARAAARSQPTPVVS
jgi:hypothetical protein